MSAMSLIGQIPSAVYISHNHTDHAGESEPSATSGIRRSVSLLHAGELPVLLMQEGKHHLMRVLAVKGVMQRLREHRLHELLSRGESASLASHHGELM